MLLCWPPSRWKWYSLFLQRGKEIWRQLLWSGDLHSSWLPAGWEGAGSTGRPGPGTACLVGLPWSYRRLMPRLTERLSKNNTDLSREREIEMNWRFLSLSSFWFSVFWTRMTFCAPLLPPHLLVWEMSTWFGSETANLPHRSENSEHHPKALWRQSIFAVMLSQFQWALV